jgi:hypothetical protein
VKIRIAEMDYAAKAIVSYKSQRQWNLYSDEVSIVIMVAGLKSLQYFFSALLHIIFTVKVSLLTILKSIMSSPAGEPRER